MDSWQHCNLQYTGKRTSCTCAQPSAFHELIRIAWHTCNVTATAEQISSMPITCTCTHKYIYTHLGDGTAFRTVYTCGHVRVICESTVDFSMQLQLAHVPMVFLAGRDSRSHRQLTRLRAGWLRNWVLIPSKGKRCFPSLQSIQLHTHWTPEALSPGVQRLWCEVQHSPPCPAEVKDA